jgi:hypothetical protein
LLAISLPVFLPPVAARAQTETAPIYSFKGGEDGDTPVDALRRKRRRRFVNLAFRRTREFENNSAKASRSVRMACGQNWPPRIAVSRKRKTGAGLETRCRRGRQPHLGRSPIIVAAREEADG